MRACNTTINMADGPRQPPPQQLAGALRQIEALTGTLQAERRETALRREMEMSMALARERRDRASKAASGPNQPSFRWVIRDLHSEGALLPAQSCLSSHATS